MDVLLSFSHHLLKNNLKGAIHFQRTLDMDPMMRRILHLKYKMGKLKSFSWDTGGKSQKF